MWHPEIFDYWARKEGDTSGVNCWRKSLDAWDTSVTAWDY